MRTRRSQQLLNSKFYILDSREGFTILELLVFSAIFAVSSMVFMAVLVSVTRVQVRQTSAAEVNQQSQFLLQTIERYVERSSVVEMTKDEATSTLKLRMPSSTADPTLMYLSGGVVYLKEGGGAAQPLTSSRVNVTEASFVRRENPGGHDSVAVSFTMAYNIGNPQRQFAQALRTAVARVSAATFDSNIVPGGSGLQIGTAPGAWQSINSTIFFNASSVGIGVTPNTAKLQVSGDVYVDDSLKGLVLKDTGGVCWRVRISTGGSLTTASTTCP